MNTEDIINERQVFLGVSAHNKDEALAFVAKEAVELGIATDEDGLKADLLHREEQMATGLAGGFAIPHAKSAHVEHPAVVYVALAEPVSWSSFDGSSLDVDRLFVLLVPEAEAGTTHLELLSSLAVCLIDEAFCEKVRALDAAAELADYLRERVAAAQDQQ